MVKVTIHQGTLIGKKSKTPNGLEYSEFIQIPYAKPPLGELRFKSPQAPEKWEGERDATQHDDNLVAFQNHFLEKTFAGTEDCLYLNVYTPSLLTNNPTLLPVMVHLHGGGFGGGNGTSKKYNNPDFLLDKEVVVVSINYRVGFLGFLSLDIPEAAGNMGLKDQTFALKWVQNNIRFFGGDKDNVTLFGISAGGASVEFHLLSPLSKDLFHRGIIQSGSTLNPWAINRNIKDLALRVARDLEYKGSDDNITDLYNFFMNITTEELKAAFKVDFNPSNKSFHCGFVPTIEKELKNVDAFLTEHPYKLLKKGIFNRVPVIRGCCDREGLCMVKLKPKLVEEIVRMKNFTDLWNNSFSSSVNDKYNAKFKEVYLENKIYDNGEDFAIDFLGDYDFSSGIFISNKLTAENGVPTYGYVFSYEGSLNFAKIMFDIKIRGACHGDDMPYILNVELPETVKPNATNEIVKSRITKMWTDFAKTGNPTPNTDPLIPLTWPTISNSELQYLIIDKQLRVAISCNEKKMAVFEELLHIREI